MESKPLIFLLNLNPSLLPCRTRVPSPYHPRGRGKVLVVKKHIKGNRGLIGQHSIALKQEYKGKLESVTEA